MSFANELNVVSSVNIALTLIFSCCLIVNNCCNLQIHSDQTMNISLSCTALFVSEQQNLELETPKLNSPWASGKIDSNVY